jgi:hypothetical protein
MGKKHDNDSDHERKIALIEIAAKVNRAREVGHDSITVTEVQWRWLMCEWDTCVVGFGAERLCKYQGLWVYEQEKVMLYG